MFEPDLTRQDVRDKDDVILHAVVVNYTKCEILYNDVESVEETLTRESIVLALPTHYLHVLLLDFLCTEVESGGFILYFHARRGGWGCAETCDALRDIGMEGLCAVVQEAHALFETVKPHFETVWREDAREWNAERFSALYTHPALSGFEELDTRFYEEYGDEIPEMSGAFIRRNYQQYIPI